MKDIDKNTMSLKEIEEISFTNLYEATASPEFTSGVYLLWYNNEVVYAGKSLSSVFMRMYVHSSGNGRKGTKLFDKVTLYGPYLTKSDIHLLELYLISVYNPVHNSDCSEIDPLSISVTIPEVVENSSVTFDYYSYGLRAVIKEERGDDIVLRKGTNHNPLIYAMTGRPN
jgi:hypothetical protein